jgi:hypothetical protein
MRNCEPLTPLHPEAMHRCSRVKSTVYQGWDMNGRRYKVYVCDECGSEFFFEPDLYSHL